MVYYMAKHINGSWDPQNISAQLSAFAYNRLPAGHLLQFQNNLT